MKESRKTLFLLAVLVAAICISAIVTSHVVRNLLDEDTSGDLMLANCLYEEKTLIPGDWFFGNEFRIYSQLIWAPFFTFFSDWGNVRLCGTLIIQLLYLASFIFMMNSASLRKRTILFGCVLLLLPYCVAYGRIVLFHSHYTMYLTFSFVILGLIFRLRCKVNPETREHYGSWKWILLAVVCVFSSLSGIREIYIFLGPLCAVVFWQFLKDRKRDYLFPALFSYVMGAAGWMINRFVIMKMISVGVENTTKIEFKGLSKVYLTIFAIFRQFGYRSGVNRISFLGMMSLAGVFAAVYVIFLSGKSLFAEKDERQQILKGMLFVQLAINFVTFLFYDPPHASRFDYSRYLVPSSVWAIPLLCCTFEEHKNLFRRVVYACICCVFIGNGLINWAFFRSTDHFTQDYDGLSYRDPDLVKNYAGAVRFLESNGYDLGYAVNDANVLVEKMNGLPVVWLDKTVDGGMIYRNLLTRKSYRELNGKKVFFLGSFSDAGSFRALPCSEGAELVYYDDFVYVYELEDQTLFKRYLDSRSDL